MSSMDTWHVDKTAAWLCEIGLDKKYGAICQKENINGRALLLLACKSFEQLVSVFQFKKGPQMIIMNGLQSHLKAFDEDKPQTLCCSEKMMSEWTVEKLCTWLRELGIPEECIAEAEQEEINGLAFLLYRKSGELKDCLKLKAGSWIILEHELSLHLEKSGNIKSDTIAELATTESTCSQAMPKQGESIFETKQWEQSKEPLAANDPTATSILETFPKVVLSKEEEKIMLLQNALQLDIESSNNAKDVKECLIRSIFVKRGKGANALEALFNFIIVTEGEMTGDKPRKLWAKLKEKAESWVRLLPVKDFQSFVQCDESEYFFHLPSKEKLSLSDGKVGQIFLEKLLHDEYKRKLFVVLVEKQLLKEKKTTYKFCFDSKQKHFFTIKLNVSSKYHASFDAHSPGQDLKLSKHSRSLISTSGDLRKSSDLKPASAQQVTHFQTPRLFTSEFVDKKYNKGFILECWETGPKDLIKPAHEFKILQGGVDVSEGDIIKKFVFETLRFACGCLNERTNGTIHFGVADEVEGKTRGHQPREIVGCCVTDKPRYNEKLTEFIDKCFVGGSRSNVHNCIRPPVFVPVKGVDWELESHDRVVIEVDIEPRYSLCEREIFKASFRCIGREERKEATAYVRRGSQTRAITDVEEMEDLLKNHLPKVDEERKRRELETRAILGMEKEDSLTHLYGKLKRLLCANKKYLDSSVYPILVLSKPSATMNEEFLSETFSFIRNIKWQVIIDFDDQGSDSDGLCKVFKSGPEAPQFDIHEAEDYVDESIIEGIDLRPHWIFANGYRKLAKKAVGLKEWNNSDRKKGLNLVMQSLAKTIPDMRAVVLFLLISTEYEPMADTFKDFCTLLGGSNQLVYAAENSDIAKDWEVRLLNTCLEKHEMRERRVVGMSWGEFKECVQQMVRGIDPCQRYVTMATGSPYPLNNVSFCNIEIVSARECDELRRLEPEDRKTISSETEINFYRGNPVTWRNFWFTDDQKNHVLRRDNYSDLKRLIEKPYIQGTEARVVTITIYHHIGAGASTMTRQALWDFRCKSDYPYRSAVITKIDNSTCKELFRFGRIGYGEENKVFVPVLALVEDTEDSLFWELHTQVVEHSNQLPRAKLPVCVFLYCKETQKPFECHSKDKEASIFLEQHLSKREIDWFKEKYRDMKGQFHNRDPQRDFDTYANENLISFMIMKENFNRKYASSIVERNLSQVTDEESILLEYTSLLSIYNPEAVFVSCFDTIMLSESLLRKKKYLNWMECLSHSAQIFLREVDRSTHSGTGKAIAIVHPIIAGELLDQIANRKQSTISQMAVDFLNSPLLENKSGSFTFKDLHLCANRMLKRRKKYEYGDDIQTKFSPLIEKILYVEDGTSRKKATEESINQAAEVLKKGLEKFKDSMLAQQMARVFYVNATAFSESRINFCFEKAHTFCKRAMEMDPKNAFYLDTMGRVQESNLKVRYGPIRKKSLIMEIDDGTEVLSLAFDAMKWFQKSQAASVDYQNTCGFRGELSVIFYMLDILRCVRIFRGSDGLKTLQGYLGFCQVVPPDVETSWSEFHKSIKDVRNRSSCCIQGLVEDFAIYKENNEEARRLLKQIASFKRQYYKFFGEGDVKWNSESPEERWEYRWYKINQHLQGDLFLSVFSIDRKTNTPRDALQELRKLAYENYCETVDRGRYNDLLLLIVTGMAMYSPYGKRSTCTSAQPVEDYKEIYRFVDRLFALERDGEHRRVYAHLFKVMFLWPRKDLELSNYCVQDFYDSVEKLQKRWERKRKKFCDTDNMTKHKIYKHMTFKEQTRQYTTLFYLGKGTGLDVFVHINELSVKGSLDWGNSHITKRLKRLKGIVHSKNIIKVENPLESNRTIDVYYSPFREGGFSKEQVSFYLGFSWAQPIAFDVKYTNAGHTRHEESSDPTLDDQVNFMESNTVLNAEVAKYEEYSARVRNLTKKLAEIDALKDKKEKGVELDANQVINSILFVPFLFKIQIC